MGFRFHRVWIIGLCLIGLSISTCKFPGLVEPQQFLLYRLLMGSLQDGSSSAEDQEEVIPPYRLSVIYNSVQYNPQTKVELGTGFEDEESVFTFALKNTGINSISLDTDDPFTINSSSAGSFQLDALEVIPEVWEVGEEVEFEIHLTPDAQSENLWVVSFRNLETDVPNFDFDFSIFVGEQIRGDILFMSTYATVDSQHGVFRLNFDKSTGNLSSLRKIGPGLGGICGAPSLVYSEDRNFIYHTASNNAGIIAGQLKGNGTYDELPGSPYPMLTGSVLIQLPTQNKFLIYRDLSSVNLESYEINSTTGALQNFQTFGFICSGSRVWASHDGNYVYTGPNPGANQDLALYESVPSGFNLLYAGGDSDPNNRLRIHLKSRNAPYIYSAAYFNDSNVLNIDNLLRRPLDGSQIPSNVDMQFPINRDGLKYLHFISHPNDQFYYLIGRESNQVGIHKVIHNPPGILTPDPLPIKPTNVASYNTPVISPDGLYLAVFAEMTVAGTCGNSFDHQQVHVYEINQTDGSLTLRSNLVHCSRQGRVMWGYKPE